MICSLCFFSFIFKDNFRIKTIIALVSIYWLKVRRGEAEMFLVEPNFFKSKQY